MQQEYNSSRSKVKNPLSWHFPVEPPRTSPVFSSVPLILNNVTAGHDLSLKSAFALSGPASLMLNYHDDIWQDHKDYKRNQLNKLFGSGQFSSNEWIKTESWKISAIKVFGHVDDNFVWHKTNFENCHQKFNTGQVDFKASGEVEKTRMFRCCEKGCPVCDKFNKTRVALENVEKIVKVAEANPGLDRVHNFIFTLPPEIEALPVNSKDYEKKLKAASSRLIKKIFGVPQSSNLWMIRSVHVVGSSDLFRDRWHLHVSVIPCHVVSKKSGDEFSRSFHWVKPSKKYTQPNKRFMLDFSIISEQWTSILNDIFKTSFSGSNFHYSFIRYTPDRNKDSYGCFTRRLTHRLKYDTRSFIDDFLVKNLLRVDIENAVAVLKQGGGCHSSISGLSYVVVPMDDLVRRYQFVRKANNSRTCGLGTVLLKYADIIGCDFAEIPKAEDEMPKKSVKSRVEVVRVKRFDPESKRVVWVNRELHTFFDPFKQRMRTIDGETLEDVDPDDRYGTQAIVYPLHKAVGFN